ncbi:galactose oxidase-like domain-containing protein [Kribbella monticola]|uniref:galactose oxidase-like domain-containing protein n=1 Tax=Kribbella monticola TaxID=2185285 RepID=UPI00130017F9|nr:galactose oxidase early set domain-containing protein [Kribbella monticola]
MKHRNGCRTHKKGWTTAFVAVFALFLSLINAATADSAPLIAPPLLRPAAAATNGITCNTVSAGELGACISRMLTDPNGAYSPEHVYTAAEKQPVYAPRQAAGVTAAEVGSWSVVGDCTVDGYKINPIHASLTRTGKVLMTAGSGYNKNFFDQKIFKTWIWDPTTPGTCPREIPMPNVDLFCSGHSHLPDGRVLFFGGTGHYATSDLYYTGIRETYAFDDVTEKFTSAGLMNVARWYPNGPVNAVGNPVVVSGLDAAGKVTSTNETYHSTTNTWSKLPGTRIFPLYAGMVLRKNGTLCYSGTNMGGKAGASPGCWNWTNNAWYPIPGLLYPDCRDQASTLLLYPAQTQKFMVIGGGCPTGLTGTTATVDLNAAAHKFTNGPYLGFAAMHSCATVLPDKSAFVAGGADHNTRPVLRAARLPVGATAWQQVASPTVPRMYHSSCMLLLDGSVVTMGTTAMQGSVESRLEVYKPWYMQPGVSRPTITSVAPTLKLGGSYSVTFSGPASVTGAMLQRLTSLTHSSDPNQRAVDVPVTATANWNQKTLKIDANRGLIPPGLYMLSLRDWRNIPSKSVVVRIVENTTATAAGSTPTASALPATGGAPAAGPIPTPAATCCCTCGTGCC